MRELYRHEESMPVITDYDVLVLGAGIAGISAAVAAARSGSRVLLVEKLCNMGGLATGGLISYFLPVCDGRGKIVSSGIAYELLRLAIESAPASIKGYPEVKKKLTAENGRVKSWFYPAVFQTVIDGFLEQNGVEVFYEAFAEMPVMDGTRCTGLILSRREGRALYRAHVYVDTTGDALVMHRAGVPTVDGDNMLSGWYLTLSADGDYTTGMIGVDAHAAFKGGSEEDVYRGLTSSDVTKYVTDVKKRIWQVEGKAVRTGKKVITSVPSVPQLRTQRRISGIDELTAEGINRHCETSVGCSADWREPGIVYEVPFGTLISEKADNIITAGRTVSASGDAYEVMRCIPQCAVTGQAAGTAAALLCAGNSGRFADLDISVVQNRLEDSGVLLHF